MATITDETLGELEQFGGDLIRPGDGGYEDARRIHNGLIDKRPALIARCLGTADVVDAVNLAREQGLELSVRGGGHNVAGRAITDGGLMVDLSAMRSVRVDPESRTAWVPGGATWADVNRETQVHGLAVTGGAVSSTGVAGLTLGGGLGWLMSEYGLAADNLVSAQVVTADGRVLTASEQENPDLFWAIRGGGGNFGVVPWFEFRLHPVGPMITGGLIVHPYDDAGDVLRFYREFTADLPDALTVFCALVHAPDGSGMQVAGYVICHTGTPDQANDDLAPLLAYGSPLETMVGPMPYTALNAMLDPNFPAGSLNYWKSSFLTGLPDELIDTLVARFPTCPSAMSAIVIEHFHGEVTRIPVTATAVPHREAGYNVVFPNIWADPGATDENVAWARATYDAVEPWFAAGRWLNYLADDADNRTVRAAYGPNYERLVELKRKYDPTNLFRLNQNIPPG